MTIFFIVRPCTYCVKVVYLSKCLEELKLKDEKDNTHTT